MLRFPLEGAACTGAVLLQQCTLAVVVAAVLTDARTLRHRGDADQPATPPHEHAANPCVAWVQEHSGQAPGTVVVGGAPPPCPCLVTPPPLMSPEQMQAVKVQAAADNAMLKGMTRIRGAALEAAKSVEDDLEAYNEKGVQQAAQTSLAAVEKNQAGALKKLLRAQRAKQEMEMEDMEAGANSKATLSATHVRETVEQWAENQAKNYIGLAANGPMAGIVRTADQTNKIRQEATELTKSAIRSSSESLQVAKKAQDAIDNIPKETVLDAKRNSTKTYEEQKVLNVELERVESSMRHIATVASESYSAALRTLEEAKTAEKTAREALETSRSNAIKIEKLKTRAQAVAKKATDAKTELDKSRGV